MPEPRLERTRDAYADPCPACDKPRARYWSVRFDRRFCDKACLEQYEATLAAIQK